MEIYEALYAAADRIDEKGHWRSSDPQSFGDCASNALAAVTGRGWSAAHQVLLNHLGSPTASARVIFDWNDRSTHEEVTSTLRALAVGLEATAIVAGAEIGVSA